jgi:aspartyl-tRNA synthetase
VEPHAAWLYDLVLNGWEVSSGSIRCHRRDIQEKIFRAIGLPPEEAQYRFGFLFEAFEYGAPAGGVAAFDRLLTQLVDVPNTNMRDVVAFPKTTNGTDPMSGAPTPIEDARRQQLGLQAAEEQKKEGNQGQAGG